MKVNDVSGDSLVCSLVPDVLHDEDAIESGEDGALEVNLLGSVLKVIVTTKDGVSCGKNRCPRVEDGGDSCLGNRYSLLLHGLVDGDSVLRSHLIELVDANHTTVSEDHGSSFKLELTRWVLDDRSC